MSADEPSLTSAAPGKRQTQTFLRTLFTERGLRPKGKLGQNFLIDLNLIDFLVRAAELTRADMVLEVGTGTGSMTSLLAASAGCVVSVEIDAAFHALARETVGDLPHVRMIHADILETKNRLNPVVLEQIEEMRGTYQPQRLKLVANLPYAVATPVISNFLLSDIAFERMVVTVQWEIAERLVAAPGTKDYGALAVLVQSLADVEILRKLPPAVFWPRPQVESGIVQVRPSAAKRELVPGALAFRLFLRDLYAHRRKNLRGALASVAGRGKKPQVDARLAELEIDGNVRAEALDVATHLRLFKRCQDPFS